MKPEHATRRIIIREWMSLPRDKRQTEQDAAAFAKKAVERHPFLYAGEPSERVRRWLSPRTGRG